MPRSARRAWIGRLALLAAGVAVLLAGGGMGGVAAASAPAATTPIQASIGMGRAPFGDYVTRLSFDVASVEPALVTATGPTVLTIAGTMTNSGPEELTNLAYRFQRGPALDSTAAVRQELTEPSEPTDRVPDQFTSIVAAVPAGGSVPFTFTTSIIDADGLDVTAPGVYPLMVNVNGAVTLEGGPLEARIGELHLLLTVMGGPGSTPAPPAPETTPTRPLPVNVVWPVVDQPHLGVGGIFLNEDLLTAISPGGRLSTLVNGLTDAAGQVPDGTVTVVIDPQLLDELDRMTGDYRVATAGQPQPSMTEMLQATGAFAATAQASEPGPTAEPSPTPTGATGNPAATPPASAAPASPPTATTPTTAVPAVETPAGSAAIRR